MERWSGRLGPLGTATSRSTSSTCGHETGFVTTKARAWMQAAEKSFLSGVTELILRHAGRSSVLWLKLIHCSSASNVVGLGSLAENVSPATQSQTNRRRRIAGALQHK
ncbi:hypothetical protein CHARACLAT_004867 [Characodon lateralis]|uniref:Uncharacterized protein n=1 Tax=Characodon lateralis TaxID=208331 RepID=A0ABU7EBB3_9TELE|nr:hypothetical protein [Characodon lateralis]